MNPGDFSKYSAKIPARWLSKVERVLGPQATRGGVLRPSEKMPVERMQQLLERSGMVGATPSRFPGLPPVIHHPAGPLGRSIRPKPVDYPRYRSLRTGEGRKGLMSMEDMAQENLLAQSMSPGGMSRAMRAELEALKRRGNVPGKLRPGIDDTPDVLRYLAEKPQRFAFSDKFLGVMGATPKGRMGREWAERVYRDPSGWRA